MPYFRIFLFAWLSEPSLTDLLKLLYFSFLYFCIFYFSPMKEEPVREGWVWRRRLLCTRSIFCIIVFLNFCISVKEEPVREVEYDEDGCYAPDQYMAAVNSGDVFQDYSFFIGNTPLPPCPPYMDGAGLLMLVFGILGICGNSLSIFVLLKKEKICFNYLLVCPPLALSSTKWLKVRSQVALNCFDTFHIVFAILDVVRISKSQILGLKNEWELIADEKQPPRALSWLSPQHLPFLPLSTI